MNVHDVPVGSLTRCQVCESQELVQALDLGSQPLCDGLLSYKAKKTESEVTYPLSLNVCLTCGLGQLGYVVDGKSVYPPSYPYRSGISKPLEEYQRAFAAGVAKRFCSPCAAKGFVVDVGSNDGTLLSGFKSAGFDVLGVEPTDVAKIARDENGVRTVQEFFTVALANWITEKHGKADIITMTNVFAHMAGLGEVMRGISRLLADEGVFITESHYLLDVLEKNQFDTIYHEHVRTYSLRSLRLLASMYGMEVFDVERGERYGGNIRAYIGWQGQREVSKNVTELVAKEDSAGLREPSKWREWRGRVRTARAQMMAFLHEAKLDGKSVAGCSAPGRAATLINYYGITPYEVSYLGELHNSLKLGKWMPGSRIPIVSNAHLIVDQPDYIILFAWHYQEVIARRLRSEGITSRLVVPLPNFKILED
jgi:SAM-dependent methyltransferase